MLEELLLATGERRGLGAGLGAEDGEAREDGLQALGPDGAVGDGDAAQVAAQVQALVDREQGEQVARLGELKRTILELLGLEPSRRPALLPFRADPSGAAPAPHAGR